MTASPIGGAAIYGLYGLSRGLGSCGIALGARRGGLRFLEDVLMNRIHLARLAASAALTVLAVAVIVAIGF